MGMFDGILGGIVGAGMVSVVNGILEQHGGLQGVVSEFEKNGLGPTVRSWVGTGPNQPIAPEEVQKALGPDLLRQLGRSAEAAASYQAALALADNDQERAFLTRRLAALER